MLGFLASEERDRSEKCSVRELNPSTMLLREPYGDALLYRLLLRACKRKAKGRIKQYCIMDCSETHLSRGRIKTAEKMLYILLF